MVQRTKTVDTPERQPRIFALGVRRTALLKNLLQTSHRPTVSCHAGLGLLFAHARRETMSLGQEGLVAHEEVSKDGSTILPTKAKSKKTAHDLPW